MTKKYNILADCKNMYEQEIVDTILANRGIKDVEHFLNPVEDDLLPLDALKNVDKVAEIIEWGLDNDKTFGILADTDVDGVSSGTIITRYLKNYTDNVETYINLGKSHGILERNIKDYKNADIIIIVDSLNSSTDMYSVLVSQGKRIIVLDHHNIDPNVNYDDVVTLVSSQRNYPNPELSGAGVVWKVCKYLDEYFLEDYADQYVDLAACGILADVCDVSEDSKENRYIVHKGLSNLENPGIKKIVGSYEFNSKSILFSIAPLINASCRIGRNEVALKLFLEDDNKKILSYKKQLEECKEIQYSELERLAPSMNMIFEEQKDMNVLNAIIDSPYGISGVIGGKCLEVYNKPIFVLKDCGDKYCGSMRSIGYENFMTLCNETGLAELHGHEQASGIEIKKENFDDFLQAINFKLDTVEQSTSAEIDIDCEIAIEDLSRSLVEKVKRINFVSGSGFRPITFKVVGLDDYSISNFKQGKHLVIKPNNYDYIQLIEWNTKCDYDALEESAMVNDPIEAFGELESGFFGRTYMLKVIMSELKVVG